MKTITISSLLESEMLFGAKASLSFAFSVEAKKEILALLSPPVIVPPAVPPVSGDWKTTALAAAVAAGYTNAILYDWDWATNVSRFDTSGLGQKGVLIARFVPTAPADNMESQISTVGYPANSGAADLAMTISTSALGPTVAAGSNYGSAPTVRYVIGVSQRIFGKPSCAELTPGTPYYISVAGRDLPAGAANYDVRLSFGKPVGH